MSDSVPICTLIFAILVLMLGMSYQNHMDLQEIKSEVVKLQKKEMKKKEQDSLDKAVALVKYKSQLNDIQLKAFSLYIEQMERGDKDE